MSEQLVLDFSGISLKDVPRVGGKNASLGELFRALTPAGIGALDGFATTADAHRLLLASHQLETRLRPLFASLRPKTLTTATARDRRPPTDEAFSIQRQAVPAPSTSAPMHLLPPIGRPRHESCIPSAAR